MSQEEPLPLSKAAHAIGVSEPCLRNWVKGRDSAGKAVAALPHVLVKGRPHVLVSVGQDHIRRHSSRLPRGMASTIAATSPADPRDQAPPSPIAGGDAAAAGSAVPEPGVPEIGAVMIDPEIRRALNGADPLTMDRHELAQRLALAGVDTGRCRVIVSAVNALQRKREGDHRIGRHVPPDDVVRMLRSYGELFVEEVDAGAPRIAAGLVRFLRDKYGLDLTAKHPNAMAEFDDFFRGQAQRTLEMIRQRVDDQTRGINQLEFAG